MAAQKNNSKIEWKKYLFEILVIITGISISFMVQNWREGQKNNETEKRVLQHMIADLSADSLAIGKEIIFMDKIILGFRAMLSEDDVQVKTDSIRQFITNGLLSYSYVKKETIGFQSLLQYEVFKNMENEDLVNDILHLYSDTYELLNELSSIDKQNILEECIPYYINNYSLIQPLGEAQLKDKSLLNYAAFSISIKGQLLKAYREALVELNTLKDNLELEVER
ncbi:MAG: hypothetical protein AAFZ15_19860 [Bacteroidota bacterium]